MIEVLVEHAIIGVLEVRGSQMLLWAKIGGISYKLQCSSLKTECIAQPWTGDSEGHDDQGAKGCCVGELDPIEMLSFHASSLT
jgi:hypothetical protein